MKGRLGIILVVALVLLAALILPACAPAPAPKPTPAPTPTPAPAPVVAKTFKFSYTMPKGTAVGKGYDWFGPEFEKRTQGRYKVEIYPNNTLVPLTAALDSVRKGVAEIVVTSTGTFPKDFALNLVTSIPTLGFNLGDSVELAGKANKAAMELYNTSPDIQAEFKGLKYLSPMVLNPYNLISKKKEVHLPKDFEGMKIGGSGAKMDIVKNAKGAPVQMIPPQSYENLDKGVVEAGFLTLSQVYDYKLWELCSYYYLADFGCGQQVILMNMDAWNAMTPADQKIMMDLWPDVWPVSAESSIGDIKKGFDALTKAGYKTTKPTAAEIAEWEKAAVPVAEKWAADAVAVGISKETCDKVLDLWKKIRIKYL
jgi:TRAP-type C4-dicarboxylate transport system substrate-binding protein